MLTEQNHRHREITKPGFVNEAAQDSLDNLRRPQQHEQIDNRAKSVTEHEPADTHDRIADRIERNPRRKVVARSEQRAMQRTFGVQDVIRPDVERTIRESSPQRVGSEQRQSDDQPEIYADPGRQKWLG